MKKHQLYLFVFFAVMLFNQCKKNIEIKNVKNQNQLDSQIIENIHIPFDIYDTIFIDKPIREVCGTILPEEQEVELKKHYDLKFDSMHYFSSLQNRIHKPVLKWTNKFYNQFNSIIEKRVGLESVSDTSYKRRRLIEDSIFYSNKVFITISSLILSNDSIQLFEYYRNARNVVESNKVYVYDNNNWSLKSIKITRQRYGWFYPFPNY